MNHELGFIGAGNMAEAIARAAIDGGVVAATAMLAADPDEQRQRVFSDLGVQVCADSRQVIAKARHLLLAVKPQTLPALGDALGGLDCDRQVVMSIMAGISTGRIEEAVGRDARVVRIMPNTPLMAGCGMAAVCRGAHARPDDDALAMKLFQAAGEAIRLDESLFDAVTAVSGSGPAYAFYLAEAMEKAACSLGLEEHARLLVSQTIRGAAALLSRGESPAELRQKVTSPGGTTEAAVKHLDGNATLQVFINAIKAAEARGRELGEGK
jgi:pyrroline-5-carboxylate reductase